MIQYTVLLERITVEDYEVRVAWHFDARTGSPANEAITALLTTLEGVNTAVIRRYDATLHVAVWITDLDPFMMDLLHTLAHDRELPVVLGTVELVPEITWHGWNPPAWFDLYARY